MARTKVTTAAPETTADGYPAVEIRKRRIATGELPPLRPREIPLINQPVPMQTWIFNTSDDAMRLYIAKNQRGWEHVKPHEVAGGVGHGDIREKDGVVVLGHKGEEYLMKMPKADWQAIQHAKGKRLIEKITDPRKIKQGTTEQMERDAKHVPASEVEHLERAAHRLGGVEILDLNVSREADPDNL